MQDITKRCKLIMIKIIKKINSYISKDSLATFILSAVVTLYLYHLIIHLDFNDTIIRIFKYSLTVIWAIFVYCTFVSYNNLLNYIKSLSSKINKSESPTICKPTCVKSDMDETIIMVPVCRRKYKYSDECRFAIKLHKEWLIVQVINFLNAYDIKYELDMINEIIFVYSIEDMRTLKNNINKFVEPTEF